MGFKPHTFQTAVHWNKERGAMLAGAGLPTLPFDFPPAFGGSGEQWTPEMLLVGAIEGCTLLTFLAFAKRKQVGVRSYESTAEGVLAPAEPGVIRFTRFEVRPVVEVESEADVEKAQAIFASLSKNCFIGASVQAEPAITPEIRVAKVAA